jgi:redox-sensitive bicupin YhaK (pirin superfamily)
MIAIRKANERGATKLDWLDSRHSFSFGEYYDPKHMGFRQLRVINEDRVQPGMGFATHGHQDMEIISYVLEGALEHKDSLGNGSVIRPGEVQRMSAGSGIRHSEFNPSKSELVHFLQIWIMPNARGLPPGYEQRTFDRDTARGRLSLLVAPHGQGGVISISQDARVWTSALEAGDRVRFEPKPGRHAWIQVTRGRAKLNGVGLEPGDGAAASDETQLEIAAESPSEILLFDLE